MLMNKLLSVAILLLSFQAFSVEADCLKEPYGFLDKGISYIGSLSNTNIRIWLKRGPHNNLTGVYRYETSGANIMLEGLLDAQEGMIVLTEKDAKGKVTGRLELKLNKNCNASPLTGKWLSPDGKKSFNVNVSPSNWRLLYGWVWLVPRNVQYHPSEMCTISARWPGFWGLPKDTERKLDTLLALKDPVVMRGHPAFCEDQNSAFLTRGYLKNIDFELLGVRHQLVSLRTNTYTDTGGAHGSDSFNCFLVDTVTGEKVDMRQWVNPQEQSTLRQLITHGITQIYRDNPPNDDEDYTVSMSTWVTPKLIDDIMKELPQICVEQDGGAIQFQQYEVGAYSLGQPSIRLSEAQLRTVLLPNNPVTKP